MLPPVAGGEAADDETQQGVREGGGFGGRRNQKQGRGPGWLDPAGSLFIARATGARAIAETPCSSSSLSRGGGAVADRKSVV